MSDRLDSDAVARVLRRAQDLAEPSGGIDGSGVSPEALVEAATEVGIDPDAVRDSLAIESMSVVPRSARRFDAVAGPASVVVERELGRPVPDVLDALEKWLVAGHRLRVDRPAPGSLRATRRSDTTASIGRFVSGLRGEGRLGVVRSMRFEAVPLTAGDDDAPRSLVRVEAHRESARSARLGGGMAIGGAGVAGGVAAATEVALIAGPAVAVPVAAGGYLVARTGRAHADRLELEVERLLSSVELDERPARLFDRAVERVGYRFRRPPHRRRSGR